MIHESDVEFHAESNGPKIAALARTQVAEIANNGGNLGFLYFLQSLDVLLALSPTLRYLDKMIHETDVEFHAESNEPRIAALALTQLAQIGNNGGNLRFL